MRKLGLALALTLGFAAPALADKVLVESPDAPKAIGPYSQAIRSGNLVFVSGALPFDPAGKIDYSQQGHGADQARHRQYRTDTESREPDFGRCGVGHGLCHRCR